MIIEFLISLLSTLVEAKGKTHATVSQAGWIKQSITPSVLTMILTFVVFALILTFALGNLMRIKTPVQFADKSLVLNKEY